jgi:hypothetical protein
MLKYKTMKKAKVKNHVFAMRINAETKEKMEQLVSNQKYKYNKTSLIEKLISEAFFKSFNQNAK